MAGKTRGRGGLRDRLLVKPGSTVNLADVDPNETFGHVMIICVTACSQECVE